MQIRDYGSVKLKNRNTAFNMYAELVLGYLSEKYGGEFDIVGLIGQSFGMPFDRWGVVHRGEEQAFSVFGYLTENGYELSDSYIAPSKRNACTEKLRAVIYQHNHGLKAGIDICEEYDNCYNSRIVLLVEQTAETEKGYAALIKKICGQISAAGFMAMINWFVVSADIFSRANEADLSAHINEIRLDAYCHGTAYVNKCNKITVYEEHKKVGSKPHAALEQAQLERLCTIIYLDGVIENSQIENNQIKNCQIASGQMESLGAILRYIKEFELSETSNRYNHYLFHKYPCEMTGAEWMNVVDDMLADAALCSLRIVKYIDVTEKNAEQYSDILPGHRAICFMDDARAAYIIFRGTSGDYEWHDNAEGMVLADTKQQLAARQFVAEVKEDRRLNVSSITVAGHSKGGNKAQYAAVTAPTGYVDRCVSIDGQGFSEQFFRNYKREIIDRSGCLQLIAERRDFINCLGLRLYKAAFITGRRGERGDGRSYGEPLPYFHCPDALRKKDGEMGDITPEGCVSKVVNELTVYFLTDSRYKALRYDIAVDIIALMMKNKRSTPNETAEALKNLTAVCFTLIAERKSFWNNIIGLVYGETELLLATIQMMEDKNTGNAKKASEDSVRRLYIDKLKQEIIKDGEFRRSFINVLMQVIQLLQKMLMDKETPEIIRLTEYIIEFIKEMQEVFIKKTAGKIVSEVFGLIKESWDKFIAVFHTKEMG